MSGRAPMHAGMPNQSVRWRPLDVMTGRHAQQVWENLDVRAARDAFERHGQRCRRP